MTTRPPEPAHPSEGLLDARRARRRSSLMLFSVLVLGAVAALLSTAALVMAPGNMTIGNARAHGLAFIVATVALVLVAAAIWQFCLVRDAGRDCIRLQRTVEALRRRGAYDEAEFTLMTRISGLIEIFTHTRNLEAVLKEAVRVLQSTLQVSAVALRLQDEEMGDFALSTEEGGPHAELGAETCRTVIASGRPLLVNDLAAGAAYQGLAEQGYGALMAAPLGRGRRATDRSIGLIAALNQGDRDFTGHELGLLTLFARHAGLIIENAQLYKRAEHLAEHDGLTNLYNHRHFVTTLNAQLAEATQLGAPVALIMSDLDNFKHYNDSHGHPKGDVLLRQVARILLDNTRQNDIVARYGGEEFVIILPATGQRGAQRVAETIRTHIERCAPEPQDAPGVMTMTLGVAVFPADAADAEALIQRADDALYRGKREGKNRVCWASPLAHDDAPPPAQEGS